MATGMELDVLVSDFGLPSVEPLSLQYMACVRMCAAPVTIRKSANPWLTPTGRFPVLRQSDGQVETADFSLKFEQFAEQLRKEAPDLALDNHIPDSKKGELYSYTAYIHEKLYPAYQYTVWMDNDNFNTVTNRWYSQKTPFPYNFYYVGKRRREAVAFLQELYPGRLVTNQDIEYATTRQALQCINLLASKLNDKKYFCGDRPTSLDGVIFSYLAPLLKMPFPNDRIQLHLKGCPNLGRFVETMISVYLPLSDEEMQEQRLGTEEWERRRQEAKADMRDQRQEAADAEHDKASPDEFPLRNKLLFGITALAVTAIAAIHFGLVKIEIREVETNVENKPVPAIPIEADFESFESVA